MIVSLGIFSVVVTTSVGALLVLVSSNQKLQGEQSAMSNLTFAMDSMTREIRTGYNYYCERVNLAGSDGHSNAERNNIFSDAENNDKKQEALGDDTKNCSSNVDEDSRRLQGISFYEGGNSITDSNTVKRVLYFYDSEAKTIKRKVGDNDAQSIVSAGLEITDAAFFVTGTTKLGAGGNNFEQPTVTIYIKAQEVGKDKEYYLQTTVTQRILDL
jgi:hypothetical protein